MERGKITIQQKGSTGRLSVHIELAEGTIWLTKHEIADLFGIYIQTVTAGLKAVFQKDDLQQEEVTRIDSYTDEKEKMCSTELYNLEVIIALSFHMKGGICRQFRQWVCERVKSPMIYFPKPPILIQLNQTLVLK